MDKPKPVNTVREWNENNILETIKFALREYTIDSGCSISENERFIEKTIKSIKDFKQKYARFAK